MTDVRVWSGRHADGFGIVEVVISMLLVSLMAVAFIPVLVQSVQLSRFNAAIATATQLLSADLDRARQSVPSCTELPANFEMNVGENYEVAGDWATLACPISAPTTLAYTSTVREDGTVLGEAVTLILVEP